MKKPCLTRRSVRTKDEEARRWRKRGDPITAERAGGGFTETCGLRERKGAARG